MLYLEIEESLCQQVFQKVKKLVAVLTTSITTTDKKTEEELERLSCIQYLVSFKDQTKALLDSKSEDKVMSQAFAY